LLREALWPSDDAISDGHVRAYHGKRAISSRTYVPRRHLAMPASTDYWINDRSGDPLLVITGEMDAALTKALPGCLAKYGAWSASSESPSCSTAAAGARNCSAG
jgi:hypothetical protein